MPASGGRLRGRERRTARFAEEEKEEEKKANEEKAGGEREGWR